ncbi:PST family polysaccharide transporter [Chryseobacterium ginsenosidimutans]|uniref:flippase n=1 Tax=Chryseobacterium ginsenosidimutans TaxID=687846 RepID=UPI00216A64BF|nr:flippase [Chryseobacterium ginsenosidimutans]MCS3871098.1 PST family polysaccharide transporter [Chryseobacterium ginsenosidimutans]
MREKKKLIRNVASLGVIQFVNYVFPLITVPYVSRIIGPDGYGIINYAAAFIGYFTLLIAYGFDLTATRRISQNSENKEYINTIISEVITARVILFLVSCILFMISIYFFKPIQKDIYIAIILFVGCISTVISPQYIFQGLQELEIFAKLNFVKGIINTVLVFILIKESSDYFWIPTLSVIFLLLINIFLFFYAVKKFHIKYEFISIKKALNLIINERMIFFSTVVISLYTSTNTVVLGFFANNKEVGYYTTSQGFLNIVNLMLTIPISTALYPFIGKGFSVSREHGINLIKKILPIVFYLTFFASIGILIFAPFLIKLIYGHKFDNSIVVLKIISFIPLIVGMSNIFGIQLMLNLGLDKVFFKATFIASIIGFILNIIMSKYWGYIGTAWNCVIIECLVTVLMYFALKKEKIEIFESKYFQLKQIILTLKNRKE